jgi:hypothetical protein
MFDETLRRVKLALGKNTRCDSVSSETNGDRLAMDAVKAVLLKEFV